MSAFPKISGKIINLIKLNKIYFTLIICILILAVFFVFRSTKSTSESSFIARAEDHFKNGKIAYAIEDYNYIVRIFPGNYDAHMRLAELYNGVNEPDKAKIEYIRAINLGYKSKYKANMAMADVYIKENKYIMAESFIKPLQDTKNKEVRQQIGDFYYKWGDYCKKTDEPEALRKYIIAYSYYKFSNSKNLKNTKEKIGTIYNDISYELAKLKKTDEAINILKLSLKYFDDPKTHYNLAKLYEKQGKIDNAMEEYKLALKLKPTPSVTTEYIKLLIKKAEISKKKGDKVSAELYYTLAKKLKPGLNVPMNPDNRIIINILAAKYNEDIDKDILVPGINLKLTNISSEKINSLKLKVVFLDDNKPFSEEIKIIATEKNPLNNDSSSPELNIFSSKSLNHVFDKHNIIARIYISQKSPDKWTLFRNVNIIKENTSDIIIPE